MLGFLEFGVYLKCWDSKYPLQCFGYIFFWSGFLDYSRSIPLRDEARCGTRRRGRTKKRCFYLKKEHFFAPMMATIFEKSLDLFLFQLDCMILPRNAKREVGCLLLFEGFEVLNSSLICVIVKNCSIANCKWWAWQKYFLSNGSILNMLWIWIIFRSVEYFFKISTNGELVVIILGIFQWKRFNGCFFLDRLKKPPS